MGVTIKNQVGGNTPNVPKPPKQVGGNTSNTKSPMKEKSMGGNYMPRTGK